MMNIRVLVLTFFCVVVALLSTDAGALPSLSGGGEMENTTMMPTAKNDAFSNSSEEGSVSFNPLSYVKKQLLMWQMYINKQIPTRMHALKNAQSYSAILFGLALAFAYGLIHTLGPGHGKMVVATYLLSRESTLFKGCMMGIKIAIAHVGMSVIIVVFADVAMRQFLLNPDEKMFYLKMFSYSIIVLVGVYMLFIAVKKLIKGKVEHYCMACGCVHGETHVSEKITSPQPTAISFSGAGTVAGVGALAAPLKVDFSATSFKEVALSDGEGVAEKSDEAESSALSLAVGMVPCTGSLLILLYAMGNDILWLGIAMVCFVALGMALMMICIGIVCLWGRQALFNKLSAESGRKKNIRLSAVIEAVGAAAIIAIGSCFMWVLLS